MEVVRWEANACLGQREADSRDERAAGDQRSVVEVGFLIAEVAVEQVRAADEDEAHACRQAIADAGIEEPEVAAATLAARAVVLEVAVLRDKRFLQHEREARSREQAQSERYAVCGELQSEARIVAAIEALVAVLRGQRNRR